mgnify:CR=1 FL=1
MSEGAPKDVVMRELSGVEKLLMYIPGYGGYKEKEIRRETDRLVRNKAATFLESATKNMDRTLVSAIEKFGPDKSRVINRIMFQLNYINNRTTKSALGYSGLFDAVKVKEEDIDMLIDNDQVLISIAEEVDRKGKEILECALRGDFDGLSKALDEISGLLSQMEQKLTAREVLLRGV